MSAQLNSLSGHAAASAKKSKVVHLMRHGITEMNVHLTKNPYGGKGFKDPLMYDTRLTEDGVAGAKEAASRIQKLDPIPEVLVVSPLTRALHTAHLAFSDYDGPVVVEALARERVWLSSDCGRSPRELREEFKGTRFSFDHLPDIWWYTGKKPDPKHVELEPQDAFKERVRKFKQYLLARPEACVAVVAHWGLIAELTGHDFDNCEVQSFRLHENGTITPDW